MFEKLAKKKRKRKILKYVMPVGLGYAGMNIAPILTILAFKNKYKDVMKDIMSPRRHTISVRKLKKLIKEKGLDTKIKINSPEALKHGPAYEVEKNIIHLPSRRTGLGSIFKDFSKVHAPSAFHEIGHAQQYKKGLLRYPRLVVSRIGRSPFMNPIVGTILMHKALKSENKNMSKYSPLAMGIPGLFATGEELGASVRSYLDMRKLRGAKEARKSIPFLLKAFLPYGVSYIGAPVLAGYLYKTYLDRKKRRR